MQVLGLQKCGKYGRTSRYEERSADCKERERDADQEDGRPIWRDGQSNATGESEHRPHVVLDHRGIFELFPDFKTSL